MNVVGKALLTRGFSIPLSVAYVWFEISVETILADFFSGDSKTLALFLLDELRVLLSLSADFGVEQLTKQSLGPADLTQRPCNSSRLVDFVLRLSMAETKEFSCIEDKAERKLA